MEPSLKDKTASSMLWSLFNSGAVEVLNLVIGIFLARLLTPADYGIVGVLTIFTLVAGNIQTFGFAQALVNLKDATDRDYNSVFWFNVIVSFVLYTILFFSAPLIAAYFHEPRLIAVSRFLFLVFLIASFNIAHIGYMNKHLMVKETATISVLALAISGVVGVTMAFNGMAYWSLAWQQVTYTAITVVGRYYFTPWHPTFHIDFRPVRRMMGFSVKILLTNIVNSLSGQVLTFIFGHYYPMRDVGNFSQANKWNTLANSFVFTSVDQVAQPVMVKAGDERERRKRVFRKLLRFSAFIAFPVMLGLALVSREFILVTIKEQWLEAIPLLQVLCVGGAFVPLHHVYQNLTISTGRSDIYMWVNISQIVLVIALVLGFRSQGIPMMVNVFSGFLILWTLVWYLVSRKLVGVTFVEFLRDIVPTLVIAAVVIAFTGWVTKPIGNLTVLLVARVLLAAALYAAVMWIVRDDTMREAVSYLRQKFHRQA